MERVLKMAYVGKTTASQLGVGGDNNVGADTGTTTALEPGKSLTVTGGTGVDTTIADSSGNLTVTVAVGSPLSVSGNNLGVNTPSPSRPLTVTGVENEMIRLDNTQASGGCAINYRTSDGTDVNWAAGIHGSDSGFYISKSSGTGTNDYVKVDTSGNVTVAGDIVLDDGGSLKEAGGTAAITFDGSGHVTKIGQDSISSGDVLTWDGAKWVGESPTTGDITGVTAGAGLSGGGNDGAVTLALDISEFSDAVVATGDKVLILDSDGSTEQLESVDDLITKTPALLTEAAVAVADDYLMFLDGGATGDAKKESIADFVSGIAGSGLSASNGQLTASGSGTITALNNQAESRLVTIGGTTTELDGEANLTFDGSTFAVSADVTVTSSTSDKPELTLTNTNADANPATMHFIKDSASPADNDELGEIVFNGDDDGGNSTMYAKIVGVSADVTHGTEDGQLFFKIRSGGGVKQICSIDATAFTIGEGEEEDTTLAFNGAAQDFRIGIDDGTDKLEIGAGTAHGTTAAIVIDGSGDVTKIGTDTPSDEQVLTCDNSNSKVVWADASGGGAYGTTFSSTAKTSNYTVASGDGVIGVNTSGGNFTVTLPSASTTNLNGKQFVIKDVNGACGTAAKHLTIATEGSETIDGAASITISQAYGAVTLGCDSAQNYWIL